MFRAPEDGPRVSFRLNNLIDEYYRQANVQPKIFDPDGFIHAGMETSLDDKGKASVGEPGTPVGVATRPMAYGGRVSGSLTPAHDVGTPSEYDHSFHKAGIVPSGMLVLRRRETLTESHRQGRLFFCLKASKLG